MEFSCHTLLNTMSLKQYKSLKFGGAPSVCIGLLGKASTKSIENILKTYQIPQGELIAAHLTKKILLITDGVLITDKALYVNPDFCPENASNRISWGELHKYFVAHPNDTASTILYRPGNQRYLLLHPTLLDKISGNELSSFLLEMQSEIIKSHPELQIERQEVFQSLNSELEKTLAVNLLDEDQQSILENLFKEPLLSEDAAKVLAINYAKTFPMKQYEQWVDTLPDIFSSAFYESLKKTWDAVTESLSNSLLEESPILSQTLLTEIYKNYISSDSLSSKELTILERLCAKLKKWEDLDYIVTILEKRKMDDAVNDLYFSKFYDANKQMRDVIQAIQSEQNPLNGKMAFWQDSMGLTPFHYALILGNKKSQLAVILSKKYPELPETQRTAFNDIGIYDLFTLAVFKGLPYSDLERMILRTDEGAKQLKKIVTSLRTEGVATTVIEVFLQCVLKAVDMAASNGYSMDFEDQYNNVSESIRSEADKSETDDRIQLAKLELYEYIDSIIQSAQQRIEIWKHSKNQTVQYLLHLYSDSNYLKKILLSDGKWTLYTADNGFFYMAPEGEIESHSLPDDAEDSWFSEKAHADIEVLKKEFRELAKMYHPDVSGETQSTIIFKEISAEYDQIQGVLTNLS